MTRSGTVSAQQRYQLLLNAGFNEGEALVMTAISYLECQDCEMSHVNSTGDVSLWQINRVHWGSSDPTQSRYGDLTDPVVSARAARAVFVGAGGDNNPTAGYEQWCTYPGGCGGASPTSWSAFNTLVQGVAASLSDPNPPAIVGGDAPGGGTYPPASVPPAGTPQQYVDPCDGASPILGSQQLGTLVCRTGNLLHMLTSPGFWWAVLLFGVGAAAVIAGVILYSKVETARR